MIASSARYPSSLERALAFTLGRATVQIAADLRTTVVDRAEIYATPIIVFLQLERRTMAILHLQISSVADEMRYPFSLVTEPLPIVTTHAHKRRKLRVTTHAAHQTV